MRTVALTLAAILTASAAFAVEKPAERGAALAAKWCVECHATSGDARAADVGPTFSDVAARRSDDYLRGFLANPHLRGAMPPFDLAERQITDLIAYFESLR